jgi:hypothetical protein
MALLAMGEFVPGYEATAWFGIGAPKGTPVDVVEKLNTTINAGLADATLQRTVKSLSFRPDICSFVGCLPEIIGCFFFARPCGRALTPGGGSTLIG